MPPSQPAPTAAQHSVCQACVALQLVCVLSANTALWAHPHARHLSGVMGRTGWIGHVNDPEQYDRRQ